MERTELNVWEGTNRLRAGPLLRHRPEGENRRMPDDWMLWKWTALMRFATFPNINSDSSNAAKLSLHSHHVFGFPMENRPPMTRRDWASELPNLNEGCENPQGGTPCTPQARGPAVAEFKYGTPTDILLRGMTCV
jgi:hypothetical protein